MYNSDVFAVLFPCDPLGKAIKAFALRENAHLLRQATIPEAPAIGSREPTPAPETDGTDSLDRIILCLSQQPKNPDEGYQFGTNPRLCDVVLGYRGTIGISRIQYSIKIDDSHRIWLHDYNSTYGTAVSYNGAKQTGQSHGSWLLSNYLGLPTPFKRIEVETSSLAIQIEFPNHEGHDPTYRMNVENYVNSRSQAVPMVAGMSLGSNITTVAPTPTRKPYVDIEFIKKGSFGSVRKVIDPGTGICYAAKTVRLEKLKRQVGETTDTWRKRKSVHENKIRGTIRNECLIMLKNPHPNIMEVVHFLEYPEPTLVMPYYPSGDLGDQGRMDENLYVESLRQILMGLEHLHERNVVHRDIKPNNLLVKHDPFTIIISDFGMSKIATDSLKTICGTHRYVAPEVYEQSYGPPADIWSTAIVILELMYKLPDYPFYGSKLWYTFVLSWVEDNTENGDKVINLLREMLTRDPATRLSAKDCLQKGDDVFKMVRKFLTHYSIDDGSGHGETKGSNREHNKQSSLTEDTIQQVNSIIRPSSSLRWGAKDNTTSPTNSDAEAKTTVIICSSEPPDEPKSKRIIFTGISQEDKEKSGRVQKETYKALISAAEPPDGHNKKARYYLRSAR